MKQWIRMAAAAAFAVCGFGAWAQKAGTEVETRLEARKVIPAADGKETFAPAGQAKPGDVIEYVATYRNTTKRAIRNLDATLPIPEQTEFVPDSDSPTGARATTDGVSFAAMPLVRKVQSQGQTVDVSVPVREYRALRWHVDSLPAEKAASFKARVRVVEDRNTGPPKGRGGSQ